MSPEIARGQVADERADIYSLGAALFHMLTGDPPFKKQGASPRDIVLRRFKVPPPDPCQYNSLLSTDTGRLVQKLMAVDAKNRPADYPTLIRQMRQLIAIIMRDARPVTTEPGDPLQALSDALGDE